MAYGLECFPNRICNKADNNLRNESFNCHRRPPFRTKIFQSSHTTSNFSQRNKAVNNAIIHTPILFCKPGFYNNFHLRLPGVSALAASVHRLVASGEAPDEAVATGCGGDGSGAATRAAEGLVLFVKMCFFEHGLRKLLSSCVTINNRDYAIFFFE